jgi:hypothetical protein
MTWRVEFDGEFEVELLAFDRDVQDSLFAAAKLLAEYGPQLGRPHVDTLKGSKYANMKELRFKAANGVPHSHLIRSARRCCSSQVIRPVRARSVFIAGLSQKLIGASLHALKH